MEAVEVIARLSSPEHLGAVKAVIAAAGCALLIAERTARGQALSTRARQWIGAALAIAAVACYFQFHQLEYKSYYHRWEFFHYYLGAKYSQELGYERLYHCAALADAQTGNLRGVRYRRMRDLRSDVLVPARQALLDPGYCTDHFTPSRWQAFRSDVAWFRGVSGGGTWWNEMQSDHGYNPSPVWTLAGHALASLSPPGDGFFKALSAIDVTLTALMFLALGWAFGWRVMVIAAVYWGTQEPSTFYWTGGSLLRQDWLFLSVLAVALLRKGWGLLAGIALAWAGLLRVFPLLLWAGPLVVVGSHLWRRKGLLRSHRRLLAGGLLGFALLGGASLHFAGVDGYRQFLHHLRVHDASPITNHMSLRTVLSATPQGRLQYTAEPQRLDPMARWQQARRVRFADMRWAFLAINALVAGAVAFACWKLRTLWIAVPLGLALIVTAVDPSCYYFSLWILAAVLTRANRTLELPVIGVACASQLVVWQVGAIDDKYASLAALYVAFTLALVWFFLRDPRVSRGTKRA